MTRNAVFVPLGIVCLCVSSIFLVSEAKAAALPETDVLYEIKHDQEFCPAAGAFADSSYAKICGTLKYPSGNVTLDPKDSEQFLCLGLYDRILRLCYLDSIKKSKKVVMPEDATKFDAEVKKSVPTNAGAILTFCTNWKNGYPPRPSRTKMYVSQLEDQLKEPLLCLKLCTDGPKFIPLCSALARMDELSVFTEVEPDKADETQGGKQTQTQAAQPQSQSQDAPSGDNKAETAGDNKADVSAKEATKTEVNSSDKSPDVPQKESPEEPKTDGKIEKPKPEEDKAKSKAASSTPAETKEPKEDPKPQTENIGKVSAPASAANVAKTKAVNDKQGANGAKEDQAEKSTEGKTTETKHSEVSANAEASDAAPPSIDAPSAPQNPGSFGDEDGDAVISQNTQDRPDDADGQEGQDNPIDADPAALPNEDNDQTAIQPSEKREYSPRMPNIPNEDDSHFFGYFTVIGVICIAGYVGYHNKQKILGMIVEGRRSRGSRSRRRPSTANYRKLDCTLEEAVTSQCNSNVTHVIY